MAQYTFRYFFDAASGVCLWSADDVTRDRYGFSIKHWELPLPENVWRKINHVIAWYDTSIDWDDAKRPSPWDADERVRFNEASSELLEVIRECLGTPFAILDERRL